MAVSFSCHTKKLTFGLLIFFLFGSSFVFGQSAHRDIGGNIKNLNTLRPYSSTHVTSIAAGSVNVDDASFFAPGDTVLLIQMQGVQILTNNDDSYGNYQTSYGKPGASEFLIVQSVTPPQVVFRNNTVNTYDVNGNIQLIRVPYMNSATVKSKFYCDPWDPITKKGGVLAIILGRNLTLEGDIDLTGLGFIGGVNNHAGDGICQVAKPTLGFFYPTTYYNAGYKGEGNAIHDFTAGGILLLPLKARGQGPNYSGGGGGNGKYSGGGGGANKGSGGIGGNEDGCLPVPGTGGKGGQASAAPSLVDRIFAGGGGGASSSASGTGGQGGSGGGIVIIVTDTLQSKGGKIIVNGAAGENGSATGGAGGGGAAGSIAMSLMSYGPLTSPLILSAKGGNGGNNAASFGEGGGGGGGLIYVSKPAASNVSSLLNGGVSTGGTDGSAGEKKETFTAILNGFLFNSIRSSITGNGIDSICTDTPMPPLNGTMPIGGTGPYTYIWEQSFNNNTSWAPIAGANAKDYTPTPPPPGTTKVYFRRTITDSSLPTALVDISKEVEIRMQPFIKGNTIGSDTTICYNQDPVPLVSTGTLTDGNGHYKFQWQLSTDNGATFSDPAFNKTESYDPPTLTSTSKYHRIVTSGRCVDTSPIVTVTVLPSIANNNILNTPPEICNGMLFDNLLGSKPATLSGGDNNFRYKWEGSINGSTWGIAPGTIDQPDYNPTELSQKVPFNEYHFRRVVLSGPDDVCSNTSNEVALKDYAVIVNNIVASPQTICSGSTPVKLTGSTPANGDGTYKYTWQESSKVNSGAWTDITGYVSSASFDYAPPALTDTIIYRRIVTSSACSDTSVSVKIVVHKPLTNYSISLLSGSSDTTICNGQDPFRIKGSAAAGGTNLPGDYAYQWKSSADNATFSNIASATAIGYDPPALTATAYYKRSVTSGACTIESTPVRISVLPLISGNTFNQDQVICYNAVPATLSATVTGGDGSFNYIWEQSTDGGSTWTPATGTGNAANYSPPALTIPIKYRRTVTSGLANCCSAVSNVVSIDLHPPLPTGKIVNTSDTTIYAGTPVLVGVSLTGTAPWKVTVSENAVDGTPMTTSDNAPVISIEPVTSAGISSFTYALSKIEDAYGCLATTLGGKKTAIIFDASMFEFPEGFSPNGDSFNNTFIIKGLDLVNQEAELSIVNSAGSEVFRTSNYPGETWTDWDGKNAKGSDLPEGTYYYLLKIRYKLNDTVFRKSGFIILKRY